MTLEGLDRFTQVPVREGAPIPPSASPPRVHEFPLFWPPWELPDYFAEPWSDIGEECIKYYKTPTFIYRKVVPPQSLLILDSLSYSFHYPSSTVLAPSTKFTVELLEQRQSRISITDRIVLNAPTGDLGHQFEFAAHHLPIPIFVRFDRHVEIGCRITIFGPFPYSVTPGTPIPGLPRFRILLSGVRSSLPADTDQLARMQRYNTDQLQQDVQKILQLVKLRSGTF